ncbi:MAG: LacI family DNA-binding transcriptional regulator, partial [Propionibacteriaceae bacterium]|nr:LacI family DNA-binding transcriptional regulator [Propionibacteriaceae bacterium]
MSQNRPQASTRSRPATLREVADRAGVSLSTASRALDPDFAYVADAVRERVRQASADLDYHPNLSARAISGGTTSMLAILVSDLQDSANADLIYSVMERGAALDLVVMIAEMGTYVDQSVRVVHRLRQMKPQAMLLAGSRLGPPAANEALDLELG